MSYYDTTMAPRYKRDEYQAMANTQNADILAHFKAVNRPLSANDVHDALYVGTNVPLTSVRRSISNLTSKGDLKKLSQLALGSYGRPVHLWSLV